MEPSGYLEHHETHIGVVVLVGQRAYKMKKPVDLGFVDFTTREKRLAACHREVQLNRRLAPDVYLDVADMVGSDGAPYEHFVVMRRMPGERRLSSLIADSEPVGESLCQLARQLASFHSEAGRDRDVREQGTSEAVHRRWADNIEGIRKYRDTVFDAHVVEETERLALRFLEGRGPLFDSRLRAERIVDGHGDLLAEDVFCLDDGPRALDCLDFDDQLRWIDAIDDVACLVMDLESLNAPDRAEEFLSWYVEFSDDRAPASLIHHYIAYRATMRAKVACLRHDEGDSDAAAQARGLLQIARGHLEAATVRLILVGGPPASGKTTLATTIADRLGITCLSSDRIRKELAGLSPEQPAPAGRDTGIYTSDWTRRTYVELLDRARQLLTRGESVILDATWTSDSHRELAAQTAQETAADLMALRCSAPEESTRERVRTRAPGASDADSSIADALADRADPWPDASTVDTTASPETTADRAIAMLGSVPAGFGWSATER